MKRTSWALTEARTVLARAETALYRIGVRELNGMPEDPQEAEIVASLEQVVETLDRWRRR